MPTQEEYDALRDRVLEWEAWATLRPPDFDFGPPVPQEITRVSSGLLFWENFESFSGWTVGVNFSIDTTRPIYVSYASPFPVLTRNSNGTESGTLREPTPVVVNDDLRYLLYDSTDGAEPWWVHVAKSTDKGKTWERLGKTQGMTQGAHVSIDCGGDLVDGEDGNVYFAALYSDGVQDTIPTPPYGGQIYSISKADLEAGLANGGNWTYHTDSPGLGSPGQFDDDTAAISSFLKDSSGVWHGWYSAGDGYSAGTRYYTGHGTFAVGLDSAFTKDGVPNDSATINNNTGTGSRPENPHVFFSPDLNKYCKLVNCVDSLGDHTNANDVYYADTISGFDDATSYRARLQYEGVDSSHAIGLIKAIKDLSNTIQFESDGSVGAYYDANNFDSHDHMNRDIWQTQLEPRSQALRFTAPSPGVASPVEYALKPLANSNFVWEFEFGFGGQSGSTYDLNAIYRHNGSITDAGGNGYVVLFRATASQPIQLYRINNGSFALLASTANLTFANDLDARNHNLQRVRIVVAGDNHKIFVNGIQRINHNDTSGSKISSGTHFGYRCAGSLVRVYGCSLYETNQITITGLTPGNEVVLRGASGTVFAKGDADSQGNAVIVSDHYPMHSLESDGVGSYVGEIWGGDTYELQEITE